jgi:hypothetical protein
MTKDERRTSFAVCSSLIARIERFAITKVTAELRPRVRLRGRGGRKPSGALRSVNLQLTPAQERRRREIEDFALHEY